MNIQSIINIVTALPTNDLQAAFDDPTNLGKEAKVVEDIISAAMPGLDGAIVVALVSLLVTGVYASGGGTISADPDPEVDAQTVVNGGRRVR